MLIIVACQQSCVENDAFKLENLHNSISKYQITSDDGVLLSEFMQCIKLHYILDRIFMAVQIPAILRIKNSNKPKAIFHWKNIFQR